jgi:hypothetical protein
MAPKNHPVFRERPTREDQDKSGYHHPAIDLSAKNHDYIIADSRNVKLAGLTKVVLAANMTPTMPAQVAPRAKAVSFVLFCLFPLPGMLFHPLKRNPLSILESVSVNNEYGKE